MSGSWIWKWLWPVVTSSVFKFQHSPPSIPLKANSSKLHISSLSFTVGRLNDVCSPTIFSYILAHFELVSICTVMLGRSVHTQDNMNYRVLSCAVSRQCCRMSETDYNTEKACLNLVIYKFLRTFFLYFT